MSNRWTHRALALALAAALLAGCSGSSSQTGGTVTPPPEGTDASVPPPPPPPADAGFQFGTPGPWPTAPLTLFDRAAGLQETIVDVSTDEAQNLWAVSHQALYLLRPGEKTFRRYTAADGLKLDNAMPPGINAVAGGAANEAFVGYEGAHVSDPQKDPDRFKGKIDRVLLQPDGTLQVYHYDIHNNDAVETVPGDPCTPVFRADGTIDPSKTDWSFNENRTVERFLYDHRFNRGTLYVGYSHGVGRIDAGKPDKVHGFDYADHVHPDVTDKRMPRFPGDTEGTKRMGEWRALALDPTERPHSQTGELQRGMLWVGGKWGAGGIHWTEGLWQWTNNCNNPWWFAMVNPPVFPVTPGDDVYFTGIAPLTDGTLYFASGLSASLGLAMWKSGKNYVPISPGAIGLPGSSIVDMQALPDDTILIALPDSVWRWNPKPEPLGKMVGPIAGLPGGVRRLYVDWMVSPTAVYVATGGGFALVRLGPAAASP